METFCNQYRQIGYPRTDTNSRPTTELSCGLEHWLSGSQSDSHLVCLLAQYPNPLLGNPGKRGLAFLPQLVMTGPFGKLLKILAIVQ